jgi:hypothetical protein
MVAVLIASGCSRTTEYPTRPLTLIVPWAAGAGTDAVARVMAGLIERDLGKPVNVVNRTGGSGVVGHQAIASARPDGYPLGIVTVEIAMMHHQGLTDLTDAAFYTARLRQFRRRGDSGPSRCTVPHARRSAAGDQGEPRQAQRVRHGPRWHLARRPGRPAR